MGEVVSHPVDLGEVHPALVTASVFGCGREILFDRFHDINYLKLCIPLIVFQVVRPLVPRGFVVCFLKVPLACRGSMAAAVQPWGTFRKHSKKPSKQVAAPPGIFTPSILYSLK